MNHPSLYRLALCRCAIRCRNDALQESFLLQEPSYISCRFSFDVRLDHKLQEHQLSTSLMCAIFWEVQRNSPCNHILYIHRRLPNLLRCMWALFFHGEPYRDLMLKFLDKWYNHNPRVCRYHIHPNQSRCRLPLFRRDVPMNAQMRE